ncbi:MAG: thiamine-phosphate pyrophosphorylase [Candidatus Omnitrophica bacterium]|nr:thiamine-phosphate pyrophosphorylase [Candidatus Omnitrophota bacterium]
MPGLNEKKIYRILDANLNRAKEGLRVCEDVFRFVLEAKTPTRQWKDIRHQLTQAAAPLGWDTLIAARDIETDVGKHSSVSENRRGDCQEVFRANVQRAKESVRVLEEFAKLVAPAAAESFKKIRYAIYAVEKQSAIRLKTLSDS